MADFIGVDVPSGPAVLVEFYGHMLWISVDGFSFHSSTANFHESYHVHGQDIRAIYASARSTFPPPIEDAEPCLLDIISSAKIRSCRDCARAQSYLHFWIDVASIKLALLWGTLRRYLYFPSDLEEDWWCLTRVPTDRLRAFNSAYVPASSPADFCGSEEFSPIFPDKFRGMLGFAEASPPQTLHTSVMVLVRRL